MMLQKIYFFTHLALIIVLLFSIFKLVGWLMLGVILEGENYLPNRDSKHLHKMSLWTFIVIVLVVLLDLIK